MSGDSVRSRDTRRTFSLTGGRNAENAVWSYESPYDEVAGIKDFVAFYPNRVDSVAVTD